MVRNHTGIDEVLELYYLPPFYILEFCLGFPGNLLVVLGYVFCLPQWQSINVYLFSLAMSDLLFLCTLPRLSYLYMKEQSETNHYACIVNRYLLHVNLYSSILFMVWVSVDRFLLIKHPTRKHFLLKPRAALVVTGLSVLAVNIQVAPMVDLMVQDMKTGNCTRCKDFASLEGKIDVLSYSLGLTLTGYVLPLLGLCLASYQIARLLRAQDEALARKTTAYQRPLRVAKAAAAMFFVLYTPYHVMRNVRLVFRGTEWHRSEKYIEGLYILTRPIAFSHSVINPVFYFLMGDRFREQLMAKVRVLVRRSRRLRDPA